MANWQNQREIAETAKNWFEVAALTVAGIWALIVALPGREKQLDSHSRMTWSQGPTPDTCIADWYVSVKNLSARSVNVREVKLDMWSLPLPLAAGATPAYIDVETARPPSTNQYLYSKTFVKDSDPLIDELAPGGTSDEHFQWVIRRPMTPQWIAFEIDLYEHHGAPHVLWFDSGTAQVCASATATEGGEK